jgi:hypothetical protein
MTFKNRPRTYVLVAVAVLAALSLIGASTSASSTPRASQVAALAPDAPPPLVITYQGRLVNPSTGEPKPDGSYTAMFELFNVDAGGAAIWSEKQDIVVSKGLFSVTLGNQAGNPIDPGLFDGYGRWLGVSIDPDGPLSPRIRVASAPYAIWSNLAGNAANADRLGGSLPSAFAAAAHSHDATNIVSGNLSTDRYHAIDDLSAEGFLGNASGDLAVNNGALQATLNADLLDGQQSSAFATASHNHDSRYVKVTGDSMSGSILGPVLTVANTSTGTGAYGIQASTVSSANGVAGVRGYAGVPGVTIIGKHGVQGESDSGMGVVGVSRDSYGTYGWSTNSWGIRAEGMNGGLSALSWGAASTTVRGENSATTDWSYGVYGEANSTNGGAAVRGDGTYVGVWGESSGRWGLYGHSTGTSNSYGVYGTVPSGSGNYAGFFSGPVHVTGNLSTGGTKPFRIDHPLDPANKYLYHFAVESPQVQNFYNGTVILDANGEAIVMLPDYFDALNADTGINYQLTCIGGYAPVYIAEEVTGNQFKIAGGTPDLKVSWQVTAIRDDPYLRDHPVQAEVDKEGSEIGKYAYPEGYGQPETMAVDQEPAQAPEPGPLEAPGGEATASVNALPEAQSDQP